MKPTEYEQELINGIVLRIDQLRNECGYSIYKLSHKADLSENTLKHIYKKCSFPNISTIYHLCDAFKIPIWQFFIFEEANVLFSKKEIELLHQYEKLSKHSKALLFEISKSLK